MASMAIILPPINISFPMWFIALIPVLLLVFFIYIWSHQRWVQAHLRDITPNRQLSFLQQQHAQIYWQLGIFMLILFGLGAVSAERHSVAPPPVVASAPITPNEPAEPPVEEASNPTPAAPSAILDLYDTPDSASLSLDLLKEQYENALAGAYILHRCERASNDEISTLLQALQQDIVRLQKQEAHRPLDPQMLYASIVSAAEGSYQMIYFHTPCDKPEVDMLEQQFAQYILRYQQAERNAATPKE